MFLPRDLVIDDLSRLARGFYDIYDIVAAPYIEHEHEPIVQLGFTFIYRGSQVIIRKPYRSNELGELSENSICWELRYRGVGQIEHSFQMIGDVMDKLKIKKKRA